MSMTSAYTTDQATDEAVLHMLRKLQRRHPAALADVLRLMPAELHNALYAAEARADVLRSTDERDGITRVHADNA